MRKLFILIIIGLSMITFASAAQDSYSIRWIIPDFNGDVDLYLNGNQNNLSVDNATNVNITGVLVNGIGNIELYVNGTLWNNGSSPLTNISTFPVIGTYPIEINYSGGSGYTSDSQTYYLTVTAQVVQGNYTCSDTFILDIKDARPFGRLCYAITSGRALGQEGSIVAT